MKPRILTIISIFLAVILVFSFFQMNSLTAKQILPESIKYSHKILLIPLDSRPPCTSFVTNLAKIAQIEIISPPEDLLDNYKIPGNQKALRAWLKENIKYADTAILSIDMLVHGGLMASRLSEGTDDDINETIYLLQEIHHDYKNINLYAFNILPRLWLGDSDDNKKHQKNILDFSKNKDIIYTFDNPIDIERQRELEKNIPQEIKANYLNLYAENEKLNKNLIDLANQGILAQLIIGQDDGQPFGIPNLIKTKLQHYVWQQNTQSNKVIITRGTDEVALTILGNINSIFQNHQPKIYVQYNDKNASGIVMPYMPHSVATTVREKIKIANAIETASPDEADFILYVYIGRSDNTAHRFSAAQEIKTLIDDGYQVALVDLSENFEQGETILPSLVANHVALNSLIAYSGWNTTSNSIGTAITQASLFTAALSNATTKEDLKELYYHNLTFLTTRFLEDWHYLKSAHAIVDNHLKREKIDVYNLDNHYDYANYLLQQEMERETRLLAKNSAYQKPIIVKNHYASFIFQIKNIEIETKFPWTRTFEIDIKPTISLFIDEDDS